MKKLSYFVENSYLHDVQEIDLFDEGLALMAYGLDLQLDHLQVIWNFDGLKYNLSQGVGFNKMRLKVPIGSGVADDCFADVELDPARRTKWPLLSC